MSANETDILRQTLASHEALDETRHIAVTGRLTALEIGQADLKGYIRGRGAALAVFLALAIPFLTEIVRAWFSQLSSVRP